MLLLCCGRGPWACSCGCCTDRTLGGPVCRTQVAIMLGSGGYLAVESAQQRTVLANQEQP